MNGENENPNGMENLDLGLPEMELTELQPGATPGELAASGEMPNEEADEMIWPVENNGVNFDIPENYFREGLDHVSNEEWLESMIMPSVGYRTMVEKLDNRLDGLDMAEASEETRNWMELVAQGARGYNRDNIFQEAIDREDAIWNTFIQSPERNLGPIRTGVGPMTGGQAITGIHALAKATAYTTAGAVIRVPLPHTGIWITLKAPMDGALLELERRIAMDRAVFGRLTGGKVFSQSDVVLKSQLIAMIMDHIVDSTYPDATADLRTVIKLTDLPILITWVAVSIYPNSFPLTQPCLANPDKCKHVVRGQVNITKMVRYNNARFSDAQRRFLARFQTRVNAPELAAYQDAFAPDGTDVYTYKGEVRFKFKVPTLAEYMEMGTEWVQMLESSIDEAFGAKISVKERNDMIAQRARATALRQYSHWIERIIYLDPKSGEMASCVEGREEIYNTLDRFSSDERISSAFYEGIDHFINASTVALVAIPNYICPKCRQRQPEGVEGFRHLIPVDAGTVFFTILSRRAMAVARRNDI